MIKQLFTLISMVLIMSCCVNKNSVIKQSDTTTSVQPSLEADSLATIDISDLSHLYVTSCAQDTGSIIDINNIEGTIIVGNYYETERMYSYTLGNKDITVKSARTLSIDVSPDQNYAAIIFDNNLIRIIDSDGIIYRNIELPLPQTQKIYTLYWVDETILAVNLFTPDRGIHSIRPIILLDINSSEIIKTLDLDIPDVNVISKIGWADILGNRIIVTKDLDKVLFPVYTKEFPLILWDINQNIEINHINQGGIYRNGGEPAWNSNQTLAITIAVPDLNPMYTTIEVPYSGGTELYSIDLQGNIKRLTYLTTSLNAEIGTYKWSPDDQRIAFKLIENMLDNNAPRYLAILDIPSGLVTNYRIPVGRDMYWSPDGRYIVYEAPDEKIQISEIYIFDTLLKTTFPVDIDGEIYGWLN